MRAIDDLKPFSDEEPNAVNVIIDTPKGSRNKYSYHEDLGLFEMSGVLTAGHVFPHDFGFIPGTLGGDGDPLDVLVIMDEPGFTGCYIQVRLIGVIEVMQTERSGEKNRNDRLIGVPINSPAHDGMRSLADVGTTIIDQIEHFFISYNTAKGKIFEPLARHNGERAVELVKRGVEAVRDKEK